MSAAAPPEGAGGKSVVVATHGHCFDGLCSAVVFTRFLRHVEGPALHFTYRGCGYGPGQNGVAPEILQGDLNAILDFRFSVSPKLSWYFDHHVSAFPSAEDRKVYDAHVTSIASAPARDRRMFHDGAYTSCTKLIADVGARFFDLDPEPLAELVRWADIIDSAAFPNPQMAVERKDPELQLMTVVEQAGDDAFLTRLVPRLLEERLTDVARDPEIVKAFQPFHESHQAFVSMVTEKAEEKGGVVLVDLSDRLLEAAGKFVTYALYPKSQYSVLLSRGKGKCKISIGFNPWCGVPRRHNIAAICERHGGGGHPVVGAISLPEGKVDEARVLARQIADELMT